MKDEHTQPKPHPKDEMSQVRMFIEVIPNHCLDRLIDKGKNYDIQ